MGKFFDDTMQGLLEVIEIEKGNIPVTERKEMPAKTYYVSDNDKELIEKLIEKGLFQQPLFCINPPSPS